MGRRGWLTQLLNLAAALAAPGSVLSELAENEGLSADRQLVTPRCLKGGSGALLLLANYQARRGECAHLKETIGNVSIWPGAAGRRLGSQGVQPGSPDVKAARGDASARGIGLRAASPRTSPRLEVVRAGATRRRQPGLLREGM